MKKGTYLTMGALVSCLMLIFAGSAVAQSIQVDMDRSTDGVQATVAKGAGETVQGSIVVDGLTGYKGHTLRIQILNLAAIEGEIIYSDGDVNGVSTQTVTQLGVDLMSSTKIFTTEPAVTTFPLAVLNFDFTLASEVSGDMIHIIYVGDASVDSRLHRSLAIVDGDGAAVSLSLENFPTIADGGIGGGVGPTDTPTVPPVATDTPTVPPVATDTPTVPPVVTETPTVPPAPTPTPGAQIVMDGFGGFHPQGTAPDLLNKESFYPGFDIVKDFEILPDLSGVVALDGYGATMLLPFAGASKMNLADALKDIDRGILPPWTPGVDQYRALVASADSMGFWVITDGGEIFGVGSVLPVGATDALVANLGLDLTDDPEKGIDGAVDFAVVQDASGVDAVIVLTAYGQQLVPIGDPAGIGIQAASGVVTSDGVNPPPYFGWDISRDIDLEPTGKGYMILDGFGGIHPMGAARDRYDEIFLNGPRPGEAPSAGGHVYFGWDVAEKIAYTPDGQGLSMLDAFGGNHYDGTITPIYTIYFGFDIARDLEIYSAGN